MLEFLSLSGNFRMNGARGCGLRILVAKRAYCYVSAMRYLREFIITSLGLTVFAFSARSEVPTAEVLSRAAAGDIAAEIRVGEAYENGEYGPSRVAEAKEWYTRAASGGSGEANFHLGVVYEFGHGVGQSYSQARTYYELGATHGSMPALYRLGMFYYSGWGVDRDRARAVELLTRAADGNYLPALRTLSKIYYFGLGVTADPAKALAWAERAAKQDDPEGEFLVGVNGLRARSPRETVQASREWLKLSSENEYTQAMIVMAFSYLHGTANEQDASLAQRWLELALEGGDGDAGFLLAVHELFLAGRRRVPLNQEAVHSALEKAAQANNHRAKEVLDLVQQGQSYPEAMKFVMTVPDETRYVQRQAAEAAKEQDSPDRRPRPIRMVKPVYPDALRLSGEKGTVMVRFVVDSTGQVTDPEVVQTSHPAFSENALAAVKQWVFTPGYKGGRPVNARMQVPVYFELSMLPSPKSVRPNLAGSAQSAAPSATP